MKATVTIEIDTDNISNYTDATIAQLWHVAQANPAPLGDPAAAEIADNLGHEIIRRWLRDHPGEMYTHQGHHPYWLELTKHGQWIGGEYTLNQTPEA